MKSRLTVLTLVTLLSVLPLWGKETISKFKAIEVTRFSKQEGVELAPEFMEFLYAKLTEELKKSGLCEQVLGEGEVVEASDLSQSLTVQGSLLEFSKGSLKKRFIPIAGPAGAGGKTVRVEVTVRRKSDNQTLYNKELKERVPYEIDAQQLAKQLASKITKELKKSLAE